MPIDVIDSFAMNAPVPIDGRNIVADLTARDTIASGVRYDGLSVYVLTDNKTYQLQGGITNGDWVDITGGGGGYWTEFGGVLTADEETIQLGGSLGQKLTYIPATSRWQFTDKDGNLNSSVFYCYIIDAINQLNCQGSVAGLTYSSYGLRDMDFLLQDSIYKYVFEDDASSDILSLDATGKLQFSPDDDGGILKWDSVSGAIVARNYLDTALADFSAQDILAAAVVSAQRYHPYPNNADFTVRLLNLSAKFVLQNPDPPADDIFAIDAYGELQLDPANNGNLLYNNGGTTWLRNYLDTAFGALALNDLAASLRVQTNLMVPYSVSSDLIFALKDASYRHVFRDDSLNELLAIDGSAAYVQVDPANDGPILKHNGSGALQLRNETDTGFEDLELDQIFSRQNNIEQKLRYGTVAGDNGKSLNYTNTTDTTDATPTDVTLLTVGEKQALVVEIEVTCFEDDYTTAGHFHKRAFYRRGTGSASQVGSTQDVVSDIKDNAATVTFNLSTNDVQARLTGIAGNLKWKIFYTHYYISQP